MNLKKLSAVAISCVMATTLLTGCSDIKNTNDSPQTRIGMISKLNAAEESVNEHLKNLEKKYMAISIKLSHDYHYYDGINELIMALQANKIDEISTYGSVAKYIIAKNPNLELLNHTSDMFDSFCCAVRKEDSKLHEDLNSAIKSMKDDGTFDELIKTYIKDSTNIAEPIAVAMPKIDGAETIKVGVTGDLPPLDLILADGTPAGFNTAVIAEISKRIGKNIKLVQIESKSRAAALMSRQIDIVFWVTIPGEFWNKIENAPKDIDKPAEIETTLPYFEDEIVHIGLK